MYSTLSLQLSWLIRININLIFHVDVSEIFRVSDTYEFEGVMFTRDNLKEYLELCAKDQLF